MTFPLPTWPIPDTGVPASLLAMDVIQSLEEVANRLFSCSKTLRLEVARKDAKVLTTRHLVSDSEIHEYISGLRAGNQDKDMRPFNWVSTYYLMQIPTGWSELPITKVSMLRLLSIVGAFPQIYHHLRTFGRKTFYQDEAYGQFDSSEHFDKHGSLTSFEWCYSIKYVQTRSEPESWSIRHALVYQKNASTEQRRDHILIRLSKPMSARLRYCLTRDEQLADQVVTQWTLIHMIFFETVHDGFRNYINFLDGKISALFDRVIVSGVLSRDLLKADTPEQSASDMKTLQSLADQARRLTVIIQVNKETLASMRAAVERTIYHVKNEQEKSSIATFLVRLSEVEKQHQMSSIGANALLERAAALSGQLRDTISLRNAITTLELSERSAYEAHVVKTLTALALIFAPASFAADFLQMGYVTIQENTTRLVVKANNGLQLYAVLAVPLVAFTMFVYAIAEFIKRRSIRTSKNDSLV